MGETDNETKLLDHIALVFSYWAYNPQGEGFSRALNGLFEVAKDIDEEGMLTAFSNGLRWSREQGPL